MRLRHRLAHCVALLMLASSLLGACDTSPPTPTPPPGPAQATATPGADGGLATATVASRPTSEGAETPTSPGQATPQPPQPLPATITPEPPPTPTSFSLIDEAEKTGKLDPDTALLYRLYAFFDRASLPSEYRSDDTGVVGDASDILTQLAERLDKAPAEVRAKAEPFLLRPDDPASFWHKPATIHPGQAGDGSQPQPALARATPTSPAGWQYVDSADTQTRVWYPKVEQGSGFAEMAEKLAREIDSSEMWDKEKQAMLGKYEPCPDTALRPNGGDGRLDVYLVSQGTGAPRQPEGGNPLVLNPLWNGLFYAPAQVPGRDCELAGYILLNNALDFKHLKTAMAHELFHAFQAATNRMTGQAEWLWWNESTATWAMDLVYPNENVEHEFIMHNPNSWSYQRRLAGPLTCTGREAVCNYTAYLWPFYLTRGGGGATIDYIGRVWEQSRDKQPIAVMAEMNGWADQWKRFALWNWNEGPADLYRDPPQEGGEGHIGPLKQLARDLAGKGYFDVPPAPWPTRGWGWPLDKGKEYSLDLDLPPAGFEYFVAGKPPEKAGILHFEFGGLNKPDMGAVQAIITVGDPAKPDARFVEDWSNLSERKFCLDRPEEYATNVVVVVSNSNLRPGDRLQGKLKVTARSETCPNSSNVSFNIGGSYHMHSQPSTGYGTANGLITTNEQLTSNWELKFKGRNNGDPEYDILATHQITVLGNGNLSGQYADSQATSTGTLSGSGISHNPTQEGDSGYGIKGFTTGSGQGINMASPTFPGYLKLYKQDGQDVYEFSMGITQILPRYNNYLRITSRCPPSGSTTSEQWFDNLTYTLRMKDAGDPSCTRPRDDSVKTGGPLFFGGIWPIYRASTAPKGMQFYHGTYDAKRGLIEGSDFFYTRSCEEAMLVDPLRQFVDDVGGGLRTPHHSFGENDPTHVSCTLYYTLRWRIELPKQP